MSKPLLKRLERIEKKASDMASCKAFHIMMVEPGENREEKLDKSGHRECYENPNIWSLIMNLGARPGEREGYRPRYK